MEYSAVKPPPVVYPTRLFDRGKLPTSPLSSQYRINTGEYRKDSGTVTTVE